MLPIFMEEAEWDVFIYSSIYPSFCATSTNKYVNIYILLYIHIHIHAHFLNEYILCLKSKSKTKTFKIAFKTQQQCININILLLQRILVLLGHIEARIQGYKLQSAHIMHCRIPYYLQGLLIL